MGTTQKQKYERRLFVARVVQVASVFSIILATFVVVTSVKEQWLIKGHKNTEYFQKRNFNQKVTETVLGNKLSAHNNLRLFSKNYGTRMLFARNLDFVDQFKVSKERIGTNLLPHDIERKRRSQSELPMRTREVPFNGHSEFASERWYNTFEEKDTFPVKYQRVDKAPTRDERKDFSKRESESSHNLNENQSYETSQSEVYQVTVIFCKNQFVNESEVNQTFRGDHKTKENEDVGKYPNKACQKEMEGEVPALWTLLYIFIILWLFIGLAIICDEFFVPSLEAISEKLKLSEDVAGATFMAAGSSAPELFTSVAGVGTGSDVGVGTIVGSAVFNLLVIIALTSALSGRILQIDWRPLVRDSTFYGISIAVFIFFSWDGYFQWWESLLLLLLYLLYIITMRLNSQLMKWMTKAPCNSCLEVKDGRVSPDINEDVEVRSPDHVDPTSRAEQVINSSSLPPPNMAHRNVLRKSMSLHSEGNNDVKSYTCCCRCCCCQSRDNAVEYKAVTALQQSHIQEAAEAAKKSPGPLLSNGSQSQNSSLVLCTECTKGQIDENEYPKSVGSIAQQSQKRGSFEMEISDASISLEVRWNTVKNGEPMNGSNKKLHVSPPPPYDNLSVKEITAKCPQCGARNTTNVNENSFSSQLNREQSGGQRSNRRRSYQLATGETTFTQNEIAEQEIIYKETSLELDLRDGAPAHNELHVSNSSSSSDVGTSQLASREGKADNSSSIPAEADNALLSVFPCLPPVRHSTPEKPDSSNCAPSMKYFGEWIIYTLSLPWLCIFTWSVPDCSKEENKKWFMLSFVISIAWIAGISYLMVEVVEKVGCLLSIDTYTMGLVVIAIGTSVPDAISSVLVAKAGYADMAVSNAIGSNVFDINLGLGFPFLIATIVSGKPVHLLTPLQTCLLENLPLPIRVIPHVKFGIILLLILVVCLIIFFLFRFKLNRTVGLVFFSMYVVFLIYAFVQEKSCYAFFC